MPRLLSSYYPRDLQSTRHMTPSRGVHDAERLRRRRPSHLVGMGIGRPGNHRLRQRGIGTASCRDDERCQSSHHRAALSKTSRSLHFASPIVSDAPRSCAVSSETRLGTRGTHCQSYRHLRQMATVSSFGRGAAAALLLFRSPDRTGLFFNSTKTLGTDGERTVVVLVRVHFKKFGASLNEPESQPYDRLFGGYLTVAEVTLRPIRHQYLALRSSFRISALRTPQLNSRPASPGIMPRPPELRDAAAVGLPAL